MSTTSLAPASRRRVLLAGLAAAAATAGLSAAAQDAQAAFTLRSCFEGGTGGASDVRGQGASFQNSAQAYFRGVFNGSNGCGGSPSAPTYTSNGSSNGIAAMGGGAGNAQQVGGGGPNVRSTATSFAATDDPPSTTQQATMNAGSTSPSDDGQVHVLPVATGASPVIIHAPEGCDLSTVANKTDAAVGAIGGSTTDTAADRTQRIRITNVLLERAFAGEDNANTWGEIAPGISGTTTNAQQNVNGVQRGCAAAPVKRIVRQDGSGTTFSFKAYLALINPSRGWLTTYVTPSNLSWPTNGSGSTTPLATGSGRPSAFCPDTAPGLLCSGTASGNGELGLAVAATDGSIGYNDLATARARGFEITPSATTQDYQYWIPLQNNPSPDPAAPTGYSEPTLDPAAHKPANTSRGANCQSVAVQNVPTPANSPNGDPTLGDWSRVFAAGGPVYGACVLTYILAWDDNAAVYGNTATEEAKARTVKDFLGSIVGAFGQQIGVADYSALPNPQSQPLLKFAQDGVNAINWNKAASSGGGGGGGGQQPPQQNPPPQPPVTTNPQVIPPTVVKPSNNYTVSSGKLSAARTTITYTVKLPAGGRLSAVSTYVRRGKTVNVSKVSVSPNGASTVKITVRLTSRARSDLRRLKRLRIRTRFTYTPAGGTAASQGKAVNVRVKAAKKKR